MTKFTLPQLSLSVTAIFRNALLLGMALLSACSDNPDALVSAAKKAIEKQDLQSATIHLRSALQKEPNHKEARFLLGTVLEQSNKLSDAEKEFRSALELGFDRNKATGLIAESMARQGKFDELLKEFGNVELSKSDANSELKTLLGTANLTRGKINDAQKAFDSALQIDPESISAMVGQARIAAVTGKEAEAQTWIGKVLARSPKDRDALSLKAALAAVKGDRESEHSIRKTLAEYFPNAVAEQYAYGMSLIERKQIDDGDAVARHLVKVAPRDPRTLQLQAIIAYYRSNYALAQELALKALSRASGFGPAQLTAGAASAQLGQHQQAIQHLIAAVNGQKSNSTARELLVLSYVAAGNASQASKELKDGLALFPNNSKLLMLAGEMAASQNDLAQAVKYFASSAAQGDTALQADLRLGQTHLAAGHEGQGVSVLEGMAKSSPKDVRSEFTLASYYLERNQPDKAIRWIDAIEKKQPSSAIAPSLKGAVFMRSGDLPNARNQFAIALQREPAHLASLNYLAHLDFIEKKPSDTRNRFAQALKHAPNNEQLALAYTRALLSASEKTPAAVEPLRAVIRNVPKSKEARLALIDILITRGEFSQSLDAAKEAVAALPNQADLMMTLGNTQLAIGDTQQALTTLTSASKLDENNPQLLLALASAQLRSSSPNVALGTLRRAHQIKPDFLPVHRAMISTYVGMKDYSSAIKVARDVRDRFPKLTTGADLEATILLSMKRWDEAVEVLKPAYKQSPEPELFLKLHGALANGGKKAQAATLLNEWFAKNPKDVTVRSYLAAKALSENNLASASSYYREALAADPKNASLLNNLAYVASKSNDPNALNYAEEANRLSPENPQILDTLASIHIQRGEIDKGIELLAKAAQDAPNVPQIRLSLVRALIKANRKADAKKELEILLSKAASTTLRAAADELLKEL